ncbi:MAG: phage tail tape measure protein, partial [Pseudomonadota bacterium]
MASAKYSTEIVINAINNSNQAFAAVNASIDRTVGRLNRMGTNMQLAGFRAAAAVGYPAMRLTRSILEAGYEFSKAQNELESVILTSIKESGLDSIEVMETLRQKAQEVANITPFDAIEVTQGQAFLGRAGLGAQQVIGATDPTAKLATALDLDLDFVADKLSNAVLSFQIPGGESNDPAIVEKAYASVADSIAYLSTNANVNGRQIFESMKSLGPLAVATGQDFEYMAGMVGALGDKGIQGGEAGVALRSTMARMMAPTKQVLAAFASLDKEIKLDDYMDVVGTLNTQNMFDSITKSGLMAQSALEPLRDQIDQIFSQQSVSALERLGSATELMIEKLNIEPDSADALYQSLAAYQSSLFENFDFRELLSDLAKDGNMPAAAAGTIFGKRHHTKMLALMQDLQKAYDLSESLRKNAFGTMDDMVRVRMQGLYGAFERLRAAWSNLLISLTAGNLGEQFIGIANAIRALVNRFEAMSDASKKSFLIWSAIGIASGPLLIYMGLLVQSLGALINALRLASMAALLMPRALLGIVPALLRLTRAFPIVAIGAMVYSVSKLSNLMKALAITTPLTALASSNNAFGKSLAAVIDREGKYSKTLHNLSTDWKLLKSNIRGLFAAFATADLELGSKMISRSLYMIKTSIKGIMSALGELAAGFGKEFMSNYFGEEADRAAAAFSRLWNNIKSIGRNIYALVGEIFEGIGKVFGLLNDSVGGGNAIAAAVIRIVEALAWLTEGLSGDGGKNVMKIIAGLYLFKGALVAVTAGLVASLGVAAKVVAAWRAAFAAIAAFRLAGQAMMTAIGAGAIAASKAAGAAAGAAWGVAYRAAVIVRVAGTKLMTAIGNGAIALATAMGAKAGVAWGTAFRAAAIMRAAGTKIVTAIGSGFLAAMSSGAAIWGVKAMAVLGKGLLRAIPFIGIGILVYEIGKLLWQAFGDEIKALGEKLSQMFPETVKAALTVGEGVIAFIRGGFAALGVQLVEALKKPFIDFKNWLKGMFQEVLGGAIDVANLLPGVNIDNPFDGITRVPEIINAAPPGVDTIQPGGPGRTGLFDPSKVTPSVSSSPRARIQTR